MATGTMTSSVGELIAQWRHTRRKSQLALAIDADVSSRHVSFLESGRAKPSREMVLRLADALHVPLRERNDLLIAAGFAPLYRETEWAAPRMHEARRALDLILARQEPFPAVVMDRHWNFILGNQGAARFFSFLIDFGKQPSPPNVLRLLFHPEAVRPYVTNWEEVASGLVQRVHREAVGGVPDETTRALLDEILSYRGVPRRFRTPDFHVPPLPFMPVDFAKDGRTFRFFSTVTTLGTPYDITLQEMRIESFFAADDATAAATEALAR
jgi:transcriptional regulator with XRE-family HTH domain